jgi:phosphomannomutase
MTKIKFGTDGWRAIIAKEYTVDNVARISEATGKWVLDNFDVPVIAIGYDCRFGGKMFTETAIKVFLAQGIKVITAPDFVSTPMVSMATRDFNASVGVVITASHNPPDYNGYKLKGHYGGPLLPEKIQEVEDMIPPTCTVDYQKVSLEEAEKSGKLKMVDMEAHYAQAIRDNFDVEAIKNSGLRLALDAMYGAGQRVLDDILPGLTKLHCKYNPSFMGQAPEPIHKNLLEFSNLIKNSSIDSGLALDGDADRIGLYNSEGEFVDSHHLILLLIHYLVKYKKMKGKVVTAFSATPRVKKMAEHYHLESQVVKIGFKYICGIMVDEDVLLGGEESGGIAIKGHIPERDGIWMGLTIWEYMAKSGKTLDELIQEVYEIVGAFHFERNDLHLSEEKKQEIIKNCEEGNYTHFDQYEVKKIETIDGHKFYFDDGSWLMIRPSGTEPVLRCYAEGENQAQADDILRACKHEIGV